MLNQGGEQQKIFRQYTKTMSNYIDVFQKYDNTPKVINKLIKERTWRMVAPDQCCWGALLEKLYRFQIPETVARYNDWRILQVFVYWHYYLCFHSVGFCFFFCLFWLRQVSRPLHLTLDWFMIRQSGNIFSFVIKKFIKFCFSIFVYIAK